MRRKATLAIVALALSRTLSAEISLDHFPVDLLFRNSDTVLVGRCESVRPAADTEPGKSNYELLFSRAAVYKGQPGATLAVESSRAVAAGPAVCAPGYSLLFLNRSNAGSYSLADYTFGIRPFAAFDPSVASAPTANDGLISLENSLMKMAGKSAPADSAGAVGALLILRDFSRLEVTTVSGLKAIAERPDPVQSLPALEMLARAEPGLYFATYVKAFRSQGHPDAEAVVRMCEAAEKPGTDSQLTPLMAMADWKDYSGLQECAMQGIRRLRAPASVGFLMRHLDDPESDVAYLAMITLSEITGLGREYAPGVEGYRANPEEFKQRWKSWWVERGAAKYEGR